MSLWCCAHRKISLLVYPREGFSSSDVINVKCILEGIHLWRKVPSISNERTILELV